MWHETQRSRHATDVQNLPWHGIIADRAARTCHTRTVPRVHSRARGTASTLRVHLARRERSIKELRKD